jgi:transcriptional regulator GlxA family with amidase domain
MKQAHAIEIGLVLYPGVQQAAVLGLADLFGVANGAAAARLARPGPPLCVTHWRQDTQEAVPRRVDERGAGEPSVPTVLIVPPTLAEPPGKDESAALAAWLRERHAEGVVLASVCIGAFLIADTGLMAGRRLTTHRTYAPMLQQRHPDVRVDADQPLIDDGDVVTAGGLMHWPALGLRLVDRLLGPTVMLETARVLLVDAPGGAARCPGVFAPPLTHGDAAVLKVQHWLQATQAKDVGLAVLAQRAGLEERTFLRRFRKATGMTSTEYCQRLRVGRASELLQFGRCSIDRVAWEVGYSDPGAFRKVFARIAGVSPGDYRRRFDAADVGSGRNDVGAAT